LEKRVIHLEDENKFIIKNEDVNIGYLGYELEDKVIYINTTYVDPKFRNGFLGKKLVDECVEYARKNNLKIVPRCSFVVRLFEKGKRYNDIKK